ncbi:hypothetical protein GBAR_LOCUS20771 [Geodia barretti]|uniref:Uncharacterized protein n=1 Tax=Geodia barretti TaxID=519541 RepID=A0AA35SXK3_GEOBA|nr:hypothetical protein GBAR_LOCUS20771 [Geodia barretti]
MSAQTEFMPSTTAMELSRFASDGRDVPRDTQPLWGLLELGAEFLSSLSPSPTDQDSCDGGGLSRPCATSYTITTPTSDLIARGNLQEARRVSFADENKSDGKGQICMDPITGELGLTDGTTTGEIFSMEHKFWINGKKGECFLLRGSSNPLFYLALDSCSSDFTVRGMVSGIPCCTYIPVFRGVVYLRRLVWRI